MSIPGIKKIRNISSLNKVLFKLYSKTYKIEFVSLRLFNVYGARSRTNSAYGAALGVFLKQKLFLDFSHQYLH